MIRLLEMDTVWMRSEADSRLLADINKDITHEQAATGRTGHYVSTMGEACVQTATGTDRYRY